MNTGVFTSILGATGRSLIFGVTIPRMIPFMIGLAELEHCSKANIAWVLTLNKTHSDIALIVFSYVMVEVWASTGDNQTKN